MEVALPIYIFSNQQIYGSSSSKGLLVDRYEREEYTKVEHHEIHQKGPKCERNRLVFRWMRFKKSGSYSFLVLIERWLIFYSGRALLFRR